MDLHKLKNLDKITNILSIIDLYIDALIKHCQKGFKHPLYFNSTIFPFVIEIMKFSNGRYKGYIYDDCLILSSTVDTLNPLQCMFDIINILLPYTGIYSFRDRISDFQ